MNACPSTFALDDAEIHGGALTDAVARHLADCDRCRARNAQRDRLAHRFDGALAAPLWSRVDGARHRSRRRWWWGLAAPALAGLAAIVLLARPGTSYRATKGDVTVEVAGRRAGAVFAVDGVTEVSPGDELQFTVRSARATTEPYVLVGSVDGTGRFSPFYPGSLEGGSVPLPSGGAPLAPPVVLDEAPGPERIVVVLSERPLDVRTLAPLVEARAAASDLNGALGAGETSVRWIVLGKRRTQQ